ncbi:MAG: exonuclease SbcCD subunit D [Chloroflexota bacterium]|nr:exonuclease SbcCD subunit D [Chloroflexota bacterium]
MTTRFLHAADIHLGYQQYNSKERYNDFARAFEQMADDAIAHEVDFVLVAGDLFHKRTIDPRTLLQATRILGRLQNKGIRVFAIEGNHDRCPENEGFSWLDYLTEVGLLSLLSAHYEGEDLICSPWSSERGGCYIDLGEVRVMGIKYCGARIPRVVRDLSKALENLPGPRPPFTILMLHTGLEGILPTYGGTLTHAQLQILRPYVDYLALGHIHKPFKRDNWIYNPGSLESNSVTESEWEDRGYFIIDVNPTRNPTHTVTEIHNARRRFICPSFEVDPYDTPEALYSALEDYLQETAREESAKERPVVVLRMTGVLPFDHSDLNIDHIDDLTREVFSPIVCSIQDVTVPNDFEIRVDDTMTRKELEHYVVKELVERDVRRRNNSEGWTRTVLKLKDMVLAGATPSEIVNELSAFQETLEDEDAKSC